MHKLKLIQGTKITDITSITGNINLSTSVDTLGATLDFTVARNFKDQNYTLTETIKTGDIIKFDNENNLFTGVIVDIDTSKFSKGIKCFDFYFYLNKNKIIKQFNELNASACIENLLKTVGAKIGTIEKIATKIDKIYKNNTVAEVIKDILEQVNSETGKKYILEIEGTTFSLVPHKKIKVTIENNLFGVPSLHESISELKNSVLVVSNDQDDESIYASVKDNNSIKKYGMLQEVIEVDPDKDDIAKVRNIAKTKLEELNKVLTTISIDVWGNDTLKAGRTLYVDIKEFSIKKEFLIKSCNHTFPKGNHICSLELEAI